MATYNPIAASTFDAEKPVFGSTVEQLNENIDATREDAFGTGVIKIETTINNGVLTNNIIPSADGFSYVLDAESGGRFFYDPVENWDLAQSPVISVTAATVSNDSPVFISCNLVTVDSTSIEAIGRVVVLLREMQTLTVTAVDPAGIYKVFIEIKYDRLGVLPV
jgi:hypothetical protein